MKRLLLIGMILGFASCSTVEKFTLPPGRCQVSADCPLSQTCRNTVCEDIYFPEHEIKQN